MRRNPNRSPLVKFFAATLFVCGTASATFLTSCGQSTSPQANLQSSPTANSSPDASPSSAANAENRLRVVATFLPIYLFTKAVAGDVAQVDILIQPGTEVHDYQSTPADVKALSETDVVVKNGLGMEEFLDSTLKSAQNPKLKIVDASKGIKPIDELSQVVQTGKEAHNHAEGNPHVWLDPVLVKQQVENIRDGLIAADPKNKTKYEANAATYLQQLTELNQEFEQRLGKFRDRTFITFHDAFPYLAQRYNLKQVAVVEIPEDQLSPADVKETIDAVKQFQAKALFSEPGVDNKLLDGLSKDLNIKLRPLDSLEAGQTDPQHYFTAMRSNLQTLEEAFK